MSNENRIVLYTCKPERRSRCAMERWLPGLIALSKLVS